MSRALRSATPTTRDALRRLLDDPIFEIVPLSNAVERALPLPSGARISVTASPNKALEDTLDTAAELLQRGFRVTPHLSARMTTDMPHLERLLGRMEALDIGAAFVVGGDADPEGEFYDGLSLLEAMDKIGHALDIGVPGYPEGHPDIPGEVLVSALANKQPHASWVTSQMCFDSEAVVSWIRGIRSSGITLPVVLGIPSPADRAKLLATSARIGVGRSMSFLRKNTGLFSAFFRRGGYDPSDLLVKVGDRLADPSLEVTGLHIYTFNQCAAAEEWRHDVLSRL